MADAGDRVEVVVAAGAQLGECPVWDARSGRLAWVDILASRLHLTDVRTGTTDVTDLPLHVGAIVPRASGGWVAALQDGFWSIGSSAPVRLAPAPEASPDRRFNDGKCDPAGRFWAGTMAYDERPGAGALYRLEPDARVTRVLDDVGISNGLAWSPDGGTMYYVDSLTRRIDAFSFDVASGAIRDRRVLVTIPPEAGYPDGLTVDAEGGLWVALWRGSALHRYVDGRLDRVVELPVTKPTNCTFGGENLDELYVTSATKDLTPEERRAQPLAGAVLRLRPGVQGLPATAFAG
jgi:sugar lactone lactonase YvrE